MNSATWISITNFYTDKESIFEEHTFMLVKFKMNLRDRLFVG